jgi:membrane protein implicated in regulation of membrane protease activity
MEIIELLFWVLSDSIVGGLILAIGVGTACAYLSSYLGFPDVAPLVAAVTAFPIYASILIHRLRKERRNRENEQDKMNKDKRYL